MSATESIEDQLAAALRILLAQAHRYKIPAEHPEMIDATSALEAYNAALQERPADRQWVMRAVVICNAHLPQDVFDRLRNSFDEEFIDVQNFHDGMIVYTGEDVDSIDEDYPEDLQNCVRWAIEQGFTHVRFDPDGEVIPELTDYGW